MQSTPTQEYRLSPELRRCCWYVILCAPILMGIFYWVARFVQNRSLAGIVVMLVFCSLFTASMVIPLRWKLRIDQNGVSRRLLFRWDLWLWSDLASGRIIKLHPVTLYDPTRSWWNRKLRLEFLGSGKIQEVMSVINTHYQLPPPPEISDRLAIKYGFRRSASFDNKGVHIRVGDKLQEYAWDDIENVLITRMDPMRRDFKSLVIVLPHHEIELKLVTHEFSTFPSWKGATSEEINEFLLQHVTPDRIEICIFGDSLMKREQIEKRLKTIREARRTIKIVAVVMLLLMSAGVIACAVKVGVLVAVGMATVLAIFLGSYMVLVVFMSRLSQKEESKLTELLNSLPPTDPQTGREVSEDEIV